MKHLFLSILVVVFFSIELHAQTNLAGVINSYDEVTAYSQFNNAMTVVTPGMWAPGDRVVVIQNTGATINTSNNSNYGTILAFNDAGRYELATICEVNGNQVVFDNILSNPYNPPAGQAQLVKIAVVAGNAVISDTVRATPWNGTTGGVVAIEASGKVTVDNPVIVDGQGFRGGAYQNSTSSNCYGFFNGPNPNDYAWNTANLGGEKGEGIAILTGGDVYGKGAAANGGGGGNDHNTGGAGGGNAGAGGQGGEHQNVAFGCTGAHHGIGGVGLNPFVTGFFGGGGGAGHGNNLGGGGGGTSGGNGGGIIIIVANHIEGGIDPLVSAEGEDITVDAQSDGAGGGGAGGLIHLQAPLVNGGLVVQTRGGDGGDVNNQNLASGRCFGPGGGGGGGVIKIGSGTVSGTNLINGGGTPGNSFNSNGNCNNSSLGAASGGGGFILFGSNIQSSLIDFVTCSILPVSWLSFSGNYRDSGNMLEWELANVSMQSRILIQRQTETGLYISLDSVPVFKRQWLDRDAPAGTSRYRLIARGQDGRESVSVEVEVEVFRPEAFAVTVKNQPVRLPSPLLLNIVLQETSIIKAKLTDMQGRLLSQKSAMMYPGETVMSLPTTNLSPGSYLLSVSGGKRQIVKRVLLR